MKKNYKFVAMLLMVLCVSTFVFAQNSNTSAATMGTIKADADYYMDVNNYKKANIENMFLYTDLSNGSVDLGFAKQFENFYLGTRYYGNLLLPVTDTNVTDNSDENTQPTYSTKDETDSTIKTTTLNGYNYFAALFGLKGGVALRLNSSVSLFGRKKSSESTVINTTTSENDSSTTTTETTSEDNQVSGSYTSFGAQFGGMSFDVSKVTLKPNASISYSLYSNDSDSSTTKTTEISNQKVSADQYLTENSVTTETEENTTKTPNELVFALGTLAEWGNKSGLFSTASLSFASTSKVGGNGVISESSDTYDYVDNVEAKNSYATKINEATIREGYKDSNICINGSYRFEYAASEKLTLGALFAPAIDMYTDCDGYEYNKIVSITDSRLKTDDEKAAVKKEMDKQNEEAKKEALKAPLSTTKRTYIFNSFAIGMKYQLKPSFAINLGFNTDLPTFFKTKTVNTEIYTDVDEGADAESPEDNSRRDVNNNQTIGDWNCGSASYSLKAGFVWDITENLSLDSVLNIGVNPSLDNIWNSTMSLSVTYKM